MKNAFLTFLFLGSTFFYIYDKTNHPTYPSIHITN